jgi:glycosyltransferase involved in cell wall biosynthesis
MAILQLRRFLFEFGVRILVTHGYKSILVGYVACRGTGVVQIPFVRGYTHEDRGVRLYEAIDRRLLRRFPRIVCVSEATREALAGHGVDATRIDVVHNAVDCELAAGVVPVDLQTEFGLPREARVLVAAGRLSPEKGHRDLLEAMQLLLDLRPPPYLVVVGDGIEAAALRRQAASSGLQDRVVFAGFRRDVLGLLAGADVVVNPSLTEGLPNVILEAFSVKTPVVATDVGGVKELVIPGETGWLTPAADPAALARAIREALQDGRRACALGTNGWRHVSTHFSFSGHAERLTGIYCELLAERPVVRQGSGRLTVQKSAKESRQ